MGSGLQEGGVLDENDGDIIRVFGLLLLNIYAQEYTQWHLAKDAIAHLGKSTINQVCYFPDGTRLAVASSKCSVQFEWKNACQWNFLVITTVGYYSRR